MNEKIRIRNSDELYLQSLGLIEAKTIFEELKIPYYLAAGTLLGAYREKDFIPWDWDVQCQFKYEDVVDNFEALIKAFESKGFELIKKNNTKKKWKLCFKKYGTEYEFTSWYLKGEWRLRYTWKLPKSFFENQDLITFYGKEFTTFSPIESYLEYHYGDWWVPKRESDKEIYNSSEFYSKSKLFRRLSSLPAKILKTMADLIKRMAI